MSHMKRRTIQDGVWHRVSRYMGCCDCGLVHKMEYKVLYDVKKKKAIIWCRAWRAKRQTAQTRKRMFGKGWQTS